MRLQTREASQGLKQQLSWSTCQPRASICDWPAATYPENMSAKSCFPTFCYPVSYPSVSVLSSVRKLPLFSQQSTQRVNNTTFFPASFDSKGDSLAASLGQRGSVGFSSLPHITLQPQSQDSLWFEFDLNLSLLCIVLSGFPKCDMSFLASSDGKVNWKLYTQRLSHVD